MEGKKSKNEQRAWGGLSLSTSMRQAVPLTCTIWLSLLLGACSSEVKAPSERDTAEKLLSQAEVLISLAPDSTIHFTDSALRASESLKNDDPIFLRLNLVRAEALFLLKRYNEAISILEPLHYRLHDLENAGIHYRSAFLLGKIFFSTGQARLALTFLKEAASFPDEALKSGELAEIEAILGSLTTSQGEHSKATAHFDRSLKLQDSLENQKRIGELPRYMAVNLLGVGDSSAALEQLELGIKEAQQRKDSIEWFRCLHRQALALATRAPERAESLFQQAFEIMPFRTDITELDQAQLDYASFLNAQNQGLKALRVLNGQMETARAQNKGAMQLAIAMQASAILEARGDLADALSWLDTAEQHILHATTIRQVHDLVDQRARVLKRKGQLEQAFLSLEAKDKLIDSVMTRIRNEAALELDRVFRNEREGIQNELLQAQLKREITMQRLLLGTLLAISFVALILGLLLKQRRDLNLHLGNAYNVLMAKYRSGEGIGDILSRRNKLHGPQERFEGNNAEDSGILERLLEYFAQEKPYLDPKFRVETAATRLQITQKQLSQAIRSSEAGSFNNLVNRFRVEESRKLMEDPELANYKVEFIGYKAGFGTKQTFYTAFEQHTGITPGFYRSNIHAKPSFDA